MNVKIDGVKCRLVMVSVLNAISSEAADCKASVKIGKHKHHKQSHTYHRAYVITKVKRPSIPETTTPIDIATF
jgi:hypothetical protein